MKRLVRLRDWLEWLSSMLIFDARPTILYWDVFATCGCRRLPATVRRRCDMQLLPWMSSAANGFQVAIRARCNHGA